MTPTEKKLATVRREICRAEETLATLLEWPAAKADLSQEIATLKAIAMDLEKRIARNRRSAARAAGIREAYRSVNMRRTAYGWE